MLNRNHKNFAHFNKKLTFESSRIKINIDPDFLISHRSLCMYNEFRRFLRKNNVEYKPFRSGQSITVPAWNLTIYFRDGCYAHFFLQIYGEKMTRLVVHIYHGNNILTLVYKLHKFKAVGVDKKIVERLMKQ